MATHLSTSPVAAFLPAVRVQSNKSFSFMRVPLACGLRLPQRSQLTNATKRSSPLPSCFNTTISCSVAQPETLDTVRSTIAKQLSIEESTVTPQTKFVDLGADSLDTVEIMMALEEKFGVSIGEGGAENIATVQDAADLIEKVKAAEGA